MIGEGDDRRAAPGAARLSSVDGSENVASLATRKRWRSLMR